MFRNAVAIRIAKQRNAVGALAYVAGLLKQFLLLFILFGFRRLRFRARFGNENIAARQYIEPPRADETFRKTFDREAGRRFRRCPCRPFAGPREVLHFGRLGRIELRIRSVRTRAPALRVKESGWR